VAVFGSSEPLAGEALYETARQLGRLLAQAGRTVVTGGYGGVMEGASRGAREGGGATLGVVCAIFSGRSPNPYLDRVVHTRDLHERTRELVDRGEAFVVLAGKAGTLAELTWLWALERAECLGRRPVVLLGDDWQPLVALLEQRGMLEPSQIRRTRFAATPERVVELLAAPDLDPGERT
jgi:uncharacterized protein (TIGR00730 family)